MPQYTGQKCSHCGHVAEENYKSQTKFKCYDGRFGVHALTTVWQSSSLKLVERSTQADSVDWNLLYLMQ
ncbi:MAG: transposase [Puniceicoccales bacterium]|nr:transposase [Puniceicoccales bacterium]